MIFVAPLNGSKFTLVERTVRALIQISHAWSNVCIIACSLDYSPRRLLTNCETRRFHSLTWENRKGPRDGAYTLGTYTTRKQRCVSPRHIRMVIYVRSMVWSIGLSLRIYLYSIECSHLVPLALSRSTAYACEGRKKYEIPTPTLSTSVALYQFFFFRGIAEIFTKTDRLSYSRQTKKWGVGRARLVNADPSPWDTFESKK